jgi:hypothetical protein
MKFQVGRFTCELSLDDNGEVQAQWLPWQPKYLNKDERVQYRVARAAFLERANPGSTVDVVDRLSSTDPPSRGCFSRNAEGSSRLSSAAGFPPSIMIFAGLGQPLSSLLVRGVVISFSARQGARSRIRESHLGATARCRPDARFIDRACRAVPAEDVRRRVFLWPADGCVEAVWGAFQWVTRKRQRFL